MIDPNDVHLLFADLQDSTVDLSATNSGATIRRASGTLVQLAEILNLPMTLSMAPRPGGPGVIAELTDHPHAGEINIRTGPSCWDHPGTRSAITAARRPVLALCGVTTEMVILSTALDALANDLQVYVLIDASGGLSDRSEAAALRQIETAGGTTTSVASMICEMVRDFTTPEGAKVVNVMHSLAQPTDEPTAHRQVR